MKIKSNILLPAFALMASAVVATAQDRPQFNPEEFRARMEERVKTSLKVTDDEWKVLQPLIEKVQTAQRESFGNRFGGFGGRGGPGGRPGGDNAAAGGGAPAAGAPATPATGGGGRQRGGSEENQALRTALETTAAHRKTSRPSSPPCARRGRKPRPTSPRPGPNCRKS